ncbi:nucleoside hydrolase [Segnochrobactrum spirostomi]|uniref:nucleoside hydrolase n=1 Tax=Segnochrobactrum spirostomi TaxID=2608987 RepID=UPI001AD849AE|nr:nucleoside hydrolase [Segnochrobactrum spirostomi]
MIGAIAVTFAIFAAPTAKAAPAADCTIIDTDFDVDDMMAIPLVIGNRHVAAIVTSEGYTTAEQGASAVSRLIAEPNQRQIPVIIGADSHRSVADIAKNWPWMVYYRDIMSRVNGLLSAPLMPSRTPAPDYVQEISKRTADCHRIDLLVIGTFSSFVHYSAAIKPKLDRIVIMGKPIGDPTQKPGKYSFNCGYDLPACKTATAELAGLKAFWVDIPRGTEPPYSPSLAMVEGLRGDGLPGALKAALFADRHTWDPAKVGIENGGPGGKALMWDQSAAVFLLHPDMFAPVGGHYEPYKGGSHAQSVATLLRVWTTDTNKAVTYK